MTDSWIEPQSTTPRKRPRPVISCFDCRRRKLKCDRLLPCQQCTKAGRADTCEYAADQEPVPRSEVKLSEEPLRKRRADHNVTKTGSTPEVDDLRDRVRKLEQVLQGQLSRGSDNVVQHQRSSPEVSLPQVADATTNQTTLENGTAAIDWSPEDVSLLDRFPVAQDFVRSLTDGHHDEELTDIAAQIRSIQCAVTITKSHRSARYGDEQEVWGHMLHMLPDRQVCETLITLYFDNFEHAFRILHRHTFMSSYKKFCSGEGSRAEYDTFVPMLIGVLSIAASLNILPDCEQPSLYGTETGIGAVQLLNNWLDLQLGPERLKTSWLQIKLLAMFIQKSRRETNLELWIMSGQVVRQAMAMDLHKAAPPSLTSLEVEMRHRLWMTILEQDLNLSILCSRPASCPLLQIPFPLNINDRDVSVDVQGSMSSRPVDEWTDSLCQHMLAKSFNDRLAAYNLRFRYKEPASYSETLQRARSVERHLQSLPGPFRLDYVHMSDSSSNTPGRLLGQMDVDTLLRLAINAAYEPFAKATQLNNAYKEARITWVQSCLIILCYQDLFDPKYPAIDVPKPDGYWDFYYTVFRYEVDQSVWAMLLEIERLSKTGHTTSGALTSDQASASNCKTPGWNLAGMVKSMEDLLEPLSRRIGREEASLKDLVTYTIIFHSLVAGQSKNVNSAIRSGLGTLAHTIRSRLEQEGYRLDSEDEYSWHQGQVASIDSGNSALRWLGEFLLPES